jgi:recombinational DNA repair protein (RecF pathway)
VRLTLIKGKSGWRIGSVEARDNFYQLATDQTARISVVAIFRSLRRYVQGEEPARALFDFCLAALRLACGPQPKSPDFNAVVSVRMLLLLGYISRVTVPAEVLDVPLSQLSQPLPADCKVILAKVLKQAETASQL